MELVCERDVPLSPTSALIMPAKESGCDSSPAVTAGESGKASNISPLKVSGGFSAVLRGRKKTYPCLYS